MADEYDYSNDAGKGFENLESSDLKQSWLDIIQLGNPQLVDGSEQFIPDARPSMIFNLASSQVYKICHVIPIRFTKKDVEWESRELGKPPVAYHDPNSLTDIVSTPGSLKRKRTNGNDVVLTYFFWTKLLEENGNNVIIRMKSTQIKRAVNWLALMQAQKQIKDGKVIQLPMYSTVYKLSTELEKKDTYSWYSWKIAFHERVSNPALIESCRIDFASQIDFLPKQLVFFNDSNGANNNEEAF